MLRNKVNTMLQAAKAGYFFDLAFLLQSKPVGSIFNLCPDTLDLHLEVKFPLQPMILMIIFCQYLIRPLPMLLVQCHPLSIWKGSLVRL